MRKALLLIGIGIAGGYFVGFADAEKHEQNVVYRLVDHVRGYGNDSDVNDVDAMMERIEKR